MCGKPLFNSVCGLSLQNSVIIVGVVELIITVVATVLNVLKYSQGYDRTECEKVDVCIGPLIKYSVFDALFGVVCSLMLIFGAKTRNVCLLICWMILTFFLSTKYIWVVVTHDWTNLEDWISITYLLFYLIVYLLVWSLYREIKTTPANYSNTQPAATVILHQTYTPVQPQYQMQQFPQQQQYNQPPPYNPQY
ncbi:uncharacterized protein LOC111710879 [Eurytemora carolleeae]|uniref:uncharacterized protein LOC111710879 n=1 Tax=Eurytemora carolleeae TaxID=1294199 RepID=UPI000C77CFEF|nr:uncharacterized protein LOC111710879 [Eurytemora carolleeae]|eukprot:XP_023340821.1 uncharacterized protein LOC111710879 [Eurytemora affinis]